MAESTEKGTEPLTRPSRHYRLPYGKGSRSLYLPRHVSVDYYPPREESDTPYTTKRIAHALQGFFQQNGNQIGRGARNKCDIVIAIAVSDRSRPAIHTLILPPLLAELREYGAGRGAECDEENSAGHSAGKSTILLFIANGLHAPASSREIVDLLPDGYEHCRIINHDANDATQLVSLGVTKAGTPITINRHFYEADYKITISIVDGHQFVGVTGGAKMAAIGLGGAETIQRNHSLYSASGARLGEIDANPVRRDIEEIGAAIGVDMHINCALNSKQEIIAMHIDGAATERGTRSFRTFARAVLQRRMVQCSGEYDCVIASAGGYPRDSNLYQLQKSLAHVAPLAKRHAPIILYGACSEGSGDSLFEAYTSSHASPAELLSAARKEKFRIGCHKGILFARDMDGRAVALVSDLAPALAESLHFIPLSAEQGAIARFFEGEGIAEGARIAVVPFACNSYFTNATCLATET